MMIIILLIMTIIIIIVMLDMLAGLYGGVVLCQAAGWEFVGYIGQYLWGHGAAVAAIFLALPAVFSGAH